MNNGAINNQTNVNTNATGVQPVNSVPVNNNVVSQMNVVKDQNNTAGQAINNTVLPTANVQNSVTDNGSSTNKTRTGKKFNLIPLLLLIIVGLAAYVFYSSNNYKSQIENLNYNCTPITASKEEIKLDLNSTIVKDLYNKVKTNIREDLAQPEFNDNMRLYLAYRQILETDKYDSNCNLFDNLKMEPYTCEVTPTFRPKAFKEETLVQKVKELYGENSNIELSNIKLGTACIGGYQYIPSRGEFVQGLCTQQTATSYKVTKTLKEATSTRTTIVLIEEVKYHENEKMALPGYLKSGIYYYTFRLDMNYNYVLVSKTYQSKY